MRHFHKVRHRPPMNLNQPPVVVRPRRSTIGTACPDMPVSTGTVLVLVGGAAIKLSERDLVRVEIATGKPIEALTAEELLGAMDAH